MPRKRKNTSAQEACPAPSTQSPGSPGPDSVATPPVSYLSDDGAPSSIASSITILDNAEGRSNSEMEQLPALSSQVSALSAMPTRTLAMAPAPLSHGPITKKAWGKPVVWTPEMTRVMVREIVQQIHVGKRSDNGFKGEVWREIVVVMLRIGEGPADTLTGEKCQSKLENVTTPITTSTCTSANYPAL